jgi:hypothetical protein
MGKCVCYVYLFAIEMEYLWISDVREYTAKTIRGHTIRMTPNTIHSTLKKGFPPWDFRFPIFEKKI